MDYAMSQEVNAILGMSKAQERHLETRHRDEDGKLYYDSIGEFWS